MRRRLPSWRASLARALLPVADEACYAEVKDALSGSGIAVGAGESALVEAGQHPADWVMAAMSGAAGLKPALAAVERGAIIALANKECLVCAGEVFAGHAARAGAHVLPVDSEHNALFQALGAGRRENLLRVIVTASGGPFRTWPLDAIGERDAGAGASASQLGDGQEDHHRFRIDDEQGPRDH